MCNIKEFFTYSADKKMMKAIRAILLRVTIFLYFCFKIKKNDLLIVYHNTGFISIVKMLRKFKKFRLIIDVNELYGIVLGKNNITKRELKYLKIADGYLLATEYLARYLEEKPKVVVSGTYEYNADNRKRKKTNRESVHCVYSGTFSASKGVHEAIRSANYLSQNYHLHILGFGTDDEVKAVKENISLVDRNAKCKVTYDGCLVGDEYTKFIQTCDIGLSTQDPDTDYSDSSFPSKIFSYLSNGLRVVSIKIPAIENSVVGDKIYYYNEQSPEKIAKAICDVDLDDDYDAQSFLEEIDKDYMMELKKLLLTVRDEQTI